MFQVQNIFSEILRIFCEGYKHIGFFEKKLLA